jgi:hypothetical protein
MYYIIETKEQLSKLKETKTCFIELVSLNEESHPSLTSACVIYYNDFEKGYIFPIKHSEAFSIELIDIVNFLSTKEKVYLLDIKWHSYFLPLENAVDVNQTVLDTTGKLPDTDCYTPLHLDFYNKFKYQEEENTIIPISKHYERCECLFDVIRPFIGKEENLPWKNEFYKAYKWVEENGLKIDEKSFDKYFEPTWKARSVRNGKIYTSYNLYNTTSRPTNTFNGINFLAFNKDNNSRRSFIPENDAFVEFDFDGYHIRLIANMLNLTLPSDESIHTLLGREYFGKEELTAEEYQESKKITFRQLYNGIEADYKGIELFNEVDELIQASWSRYKETGFLLLPNGRKITIENPTPQKLFNYYVQCLETVNNIKKLSKLRELLINKKSKVILVVYDSILVDFSKLDGRQTLEEIKNVLEEDGYKVKVRIGSNYSFNS